MDKDKKFLKTIILIGTWLITFLIFHLVDRSKGLFLINLPLIIFSILAAYLAYITTIVKRIKLFTITASFIAGVALFSYLIFPNWQNWVMFRNAYEITKLKEITLETKNGEMISTNSFMRKTTVIDYWSTTCGVCYKKFPEFEKLHKMYEQDTNIVFYSIHIPTKHDSIEKSKKLLDKHDYSFTPISLFTLFRYSGIRKLTVDRKISSPEMSGLHCRATLQSRFKS